VAVFKGLANNAINNATDSAKAEPLIFLTAK
jgi:hypothetical protein